MRDRISTVIDRTITDPFVQQFANDADQSPTVMQFCIGMFKKDERQANNTKVEIRTASIIQEAFKEEVCVLWTEQVNQSSSGCMWHEESGWPADLHLRSYDQDWASCQSTLSATPWSWTDWWRVNVYSKRQTLVLILCQVAISSFHLAQ